VFDETDDNGNGLMEFREFQALVTSVNPSADQEGGMHGQFKLGIGVTHPIRLVAVGYSHRHTPYMAAMMDLFDRALGMSSDQMGEEMDAVTKEAFIEVVMAAWVPTFVSIIDGQLPQPAGTS
jgi:hypothetical protein